MKVFFDALKKEYTEFGMRMPDDDTKIDDQLGLVEKILSNSLSGGKLGNPKKVSLNSFSTGYIDSCDVIFHGRMMAPFIINIKYKLENFVDFNPAKDLVAKIVLDKLTESVVSHSIGSLVHFGNIFLQKGCSESALSIPKKYSSGSLMIENFDLALMFDANKNPSILYLNHPRPHSSFQKDIPQTKTFPTSKYGNNLNAIELGIFELHNKFLENLKP